jgi:hypothetical protein
MKPLQGIPQVGGPEKRKRFRKNIPDDHDGVQKGPVYPKVDEVLI